MKKLLVTLAAGAVAMTSCTGLSGGSDQLKAENDSLLMELSHRNAELDEMMGTFNEISNGFRQINEAEGRVDLQRGSIVEGGETVKEQMAHDIEFIRKQMEENRELISKLQAQLRNSRNNSAQLKKAVDALTQELEAKTLRIEELQRELAAKNIHIMELDAAVIKLKADREVLVSENEAKAQALSDQDRKLNAAWFVFGTKKELKENNILDKGNLFKKAEVMKNENVNMNYFTQIDIRTTREIKLYSKSAKLLTEHPDGSYELEKDSKDELTFKITNPAEFWKISRYLVIEVK